MMYAPRALSSIAFEMISFFVSSLATIAIHGVPSVIKAIGPCLSSPPANPSAWMYETSWILIAPSRAIG